MVDLETQLRRYADEVEAAVPEVPATVASAPPRRWRPWLMGGAAALVAVVGLAVALSGDDPDSGPVEVDRAGDGDEVDGDDVDGDGAPGPTPSVEIDEEWSVDGWLPADALLDAGPLSPRTSAAVVPLGDQVLVWGGSTETEYFADGAIYDVATRDWSMMSPSPLPASQFAAAHLVLGDRVLIGRGDGAAFYDPAADVWSPMSAVEEPVTFREFAEADDGRVFGWGGSGAAVFDPNASEWAVIDETDDASGYATTSDFVFTGEEFLAVRWDGDPGAGLPPFRIEVWDEAAGSWNPQLLGLDTFTPTGAFFFDAEWFGGPDGYGLVVAENGTAFEFSLEGPRVLVEPMPGGYELRPEILGTDSAGRVLVSYPPEIHVLDGGTWTSAPLPDGLWQTSVDPDGTTLWTFGYWRAELDVRNYFAAVDIDSLFATTGDAGPTEDLFNVPPGMSFPAAPLTTRSGALTMRVGDEVVVWGGEREDAGFNEVYSDGAVLDLVTNEWRSMAESPIPSVDYPPRAVDLGDGVLFVSRREHAALYDVAADEWTALPSVANEVRLRELRHAPEIDSVFALADAGVHRFDLGSQEWTDLGGRGDSIEWTGEELVSVTGNLVGSFLVDTWTPDDGWVEQTVIETGVSQVALDTGLVDGEVWIVGYDMTVDAWNPSTGEQRSLPPLPIVFNEGVPTVYVDERDGPDAVVVERLPGLAVWDGDGWQVTTIPDAAGFAASLGPDDGWWRFVYDWDSQSSSLVVEPFVDPVDVREVVLGSLVIELARGESLTEMGVADTADARGVVNAWARLAMPIGECLIDDEVRNESDGFFRLVLGGEVISVRCDDPEAPLRLAERVRSAWDDDGRSAIVLGVNNVDTDGMTLVPSVVGLFEDNAMATLRNSGLEPVVEFIAVPFGDPQVGVVMSQSPDPFGLVPPGAQVVITVGDAG